MRKLITIIVYTLLMLAIGRNLSFLPRFAGPSQKTENTLFLKNAIQTQLALQKGTYSVYYANFTSNASLGINENQIFTAASVNKIPIVAVLYFLAQKGKVNLDQKLTIQETDIQDYGTGSLRYEDPGGSYSLKTLARLTLQRSDNTAAHVLANMIGTDTIQKTITSWGLTQTDIEQNKSSVYDMFLLFKKIYKNEIASKSLTKEILGFMRDTEFEDRLPAKLPSGTIVYHKTGDAVGNIHDVGIIQNGSVVFFLGIMMSDITDEKQAKQTEATIAEKIYDSQIKNDD